MFVCDSFVGVRKLTRRDPLWYSSKDYEDRVRHASEAGRTLAGGSDPKANGGYVGTIGSTEIRVQFCVQKGRPFDYVYLQCRDLEEERPAWKARLNVAVNETVGREAAEKIMNAMQSPKRCLRRR